MKQTEHGDHVMFVGGVIEISADENIKSLIYHNGKYRQIGEDIPKPPASVLATIEKLAEKHNRLRY
jgi:flavin reductase (DIM6/NTAB) family NADH-FMN oxidoreductase RutF